MTSEEFLSTRFCEMKTQLIAEGHFCCSGRNATNFYSVGGSDMTGSHFTMERVSVGVELGPIRRAVSEARYVDEGQYIAGFFEFR